jgi:hypothetical protein
VFARSVRTLLVRFSQNELKMDLSRAIADINEEIVSKRVAAEQTGDDLELLRSEAELRALLAAQIEITAEGAEAEGADASDDNDSLVGGKFVDQDQPPVLPPSVVSRVREASLRAKAILRSRSRRSSGLAQAPGNVSTTTPTFDPSHSFASSSALPASQSQPAVPNTSFNKELFFCNLEIRSLVVDIAETPAAPDAASPPTPLFQLNLSNLNLSSRARSFDFRSSLSLRSFALISNPHPSVSSELLTGFPSSQSKLHSAFPHLFNYQHHQHHHHRGGAHGQSGSSGDAENKFLRVLVEKTKKRQASSSPSLRLKVTLGSLDLSLDQATLPSQLAFLREKVRAKRQRLHLFNSSPLTPPPSGPPRPPPYLPAAPPSR